MYPEARHRREKAQRATGGHAGADGRRLSWRLFILGSCLAATVSCSNSALSSGRASTSLVIEQLAAAKGNDTTTFTNVLQSDVVTNVNVIAGGATAQSPTVFEDVAQVIMRLAFNDPGTPTNPSSPTSANWITVDRYRVEFIRGDGRNTPGVDVPHPFDGGVTFTVLDIGSATFTLVRGQAKLEPPLLALRGTGGAVVISTIAEITFFGHDQTGSEVIARGRVSVNFADWGD
jgi:hypothetical protein